jgi:hypothetical protein
MKRSIQRSMVAMGLVTAIAGISMAAKAQVVPDGQAHRQHPGHQAAGHTDSDHHARHRQLREDKHPRRLDRLKTALKLSDTQEADWRAFVEQTSPVHRGRTLSVASGLSGPSSQPLTVLQRLDRMQTSQQEHSAHLQRRLDAVRHFYARLTPEQQKTWDALDHDTHGGSRWIPGAHHPWLHGSRNHDRHRLEGATRSVPPTPPAQPSKN